MPGDVVTGPITHLGQPAMLEIVRGAPAADERQRSQEALERARAAMDTAPDAIFLVDRESLKYVDVNTAVCRMLGYTRGELMQMGPEGVTVGSTVQRCCGSSLP